MDVEGRKSRMERDQTDEGLRAEREQTDRALALRSASIEADADVALSRAREQADGVLNAARERADKKTEMAEPHVQKSDILAEERALEDDAVQRERAIADESLRLTREEHARALCKLLPLERDKTDRLLLTERARSDDALSNRDDILIIVSHDLRNLLSGIVMSAEQLAGNASDSEEEGRQTVLVAERIRRYGARMNRLIGDLVDIASIEGGKLAVTPVRGDAAMPVAEAIEMFRPAAAAKELSLEAEFIEAPLPADFDHGRMLQVFANLITNSIKFTLPGGRIRVRGERDGGEVRFCVSDTGLGIHGDMLELVFERFWQAGKDDRRGLGLGLYISRCIVEAHGGRLWVESRLGAGSRFYLTLPGVEAGVATSAPRPHAPPP
jgi:signal transduction histidine kinase